MTTKRQMRVGGFALGRLAVRGGRLSAQDLEGAIRRQRELEKEGRRVHLGELLVEMGLLGMQEVEDLLAEQRRLSVVCPRCKGRYSAGLFEPGCRVRCPGCSNILVIPPRPETPAGNAPDLYEVWSETQVRRREPMDVGRADHSMLAARVDQLALPLALVREISTSPQEDDPESPDSFLGRSISRLNLVSRLGAGGWGRVYLARHEYLDRHFAVKVLSQELATTSENIERFMAEARITAGLQHPLIRHVYDAGRDGSDFFMTMEYIDGCGLHAFVDQVGPLAMDCAVRVIRQIAAALVYAQDRGIVHRDIKPNNILVGLDGYIRLTDFGLAKTFYAGSSLTATGMILGTPEYMSPEQFEGRRVDHRSDIYSLGCTLFFLLVGQPPFDAADFFGLMTQHKSQSPPSPLRYRPDLSPRLCAVLSRMLAKPLASRYASYAELDADLAAAVEQQVVPTTPLQVGGGTGSPILAEWMDQQRWKRCEEIRGVFEDAGFRPVPLSWVMGDLGYFDVLPDEGGTTDFEVVCASGEHAWRGSEVLARDGAACPTCGADLRVGRHVTLGRRACYVELRVDAAAQEDFAARRELRDVMLVLAARMHRNIVLDLSTFRTLGSEIVTILASLQECATNSKSFVVVLVQPKVRERACSGAGLEDFLWLYDDADAWEKDLQDGQACPHLRGWLAATRGLLGDEVVPPPPECLRGCAGEKAFGEFHATVCEDLRRLHVPRVQEALRTLAPPERDPCIFAVSAWTRRITYDALRAGLHRYAQSSLRRGRLDRARRCAEFLLQLFADNPLGHDLLGRVAMQSGRPRLAVEHFREAVRLSPTPEEHLLDLAAAHRAAGDVDAALEAAGRVVAADPDHCRAWLFLATTSLASGKHREALDQVDAALRVDASNPGAHTIRAKVLHRLGHPRKAIQAYEAALALEPHDAALLSSCGALHVKLDELRRAEERLREALQINPGLAGPHYNLACLFARRKDYAGALTSLRSAVERGFDRVELLESDADLAPLRRRPELRPHFDKLAEEVRTMRRPDSADVAAK